jgi:alkylhydroperoxidase family enzyme
MIPLLSREETQKRAKEVGLGEDYAKLNVFRMFLQNPVVARAAENLITTLMNRNTIEARTRELIILRTAWRAGSASSAARAQPENFRAGDPRRARP